MKRSTLLLNAVYIVGAILSVASIALVLLAGLENWHKVLVAGLLGLSIVASSYLAWVLSSTGRRSYTRASMVATANGLIESASKEIVMLAGDMSWAPDHVLALRRAASSGSKSVSVLFPESQSTGPKTVEALQLLTANGIKPQPVDVDYDLRALMVDPGESDGVAFLVRKQKATGPAERDRYFGKLYTHEDDPDLMRALRDFCDLLKGRHCV